MERLQPYLDLIKDPQIKEFTEECLKVAPKYFWEIPSSSSGSHHPEWALGEGGLVRHTAFAMYVGHELNTTFGLIGWEKDVVLSALALHDTLKYGIDEYDERYHKMHSYLPRVHYREKSRIVDDFTYDLIMKAIESHMGCLDHGGWHPVGKVRPESQIEQVVHIADYIASRKKINFADFQGDV